MNIKKLIVTFSLIVFAFSIIPVKAQPLSLSKEQMIQYTPLWEGERFPDGRPKVPDDIIKRMKYVSITEAWELVRRGSGSGGARGGGARGGMRGGFVGGTYENQYVSSLKPMHKDVTICGRAMTAHFMPARPDINQAISQQGREDGRTSGQYTWGIDMLQQGDVYVANVCEAILDASHVGDNLGTSIFHHSGNGAIIWGTLRDLEGNKTIKGFNVFVRDFRPQSNANNMMMGLNCPLQLDYVTVMPGDIVLAKEMGIVFIPPHLAENVVVNSEKTRLRDAFAHIGVMEGRFTAQQADGGFTPQMNQEFTQWLKDNLDDMGKFFEDPNEVPSKEFIQGYIDERQ